MQMRRWNRPAVSYDKAFNRTGIPAPAVFPDSCRRADSRHHPPGPGCGRLRGTVPGVRLLVVNLDTLDEQRAVVKEKGKFLFPQMPPGDYAVIAAAPVETPCFRPIVERVKLEADTTRNIKLVMIANPGACAAAQ